jgi:two-component system, NtrC family, response regulator HupR/HoxA
MESSFKILAVDDSSELLFSLEGLLTEKGFCVRTAQNGQEAWQRLQEELPDLVLSDVNMPGMDGYELTRRIKSDPVFKYIPVILVTARDELSDIIHGLEQGANDYIRKPFSGDELIARLKSALKTRSIYLELQKSEASNQELKGKLGTRYLYSNIIGQGAAMQAVFDLIDKVKDADAPVLISGESGTGKELVACAIHYQSPRRHARLVVQNCSAFNENLLESELFGHVKGAFTGAIRDKQGLFEAAHEGTFFLDELGEMSAALQVKLLRVLQDGTFTPVGGTEQKKVNVRILAATNRDLRKMVAEGQFREDLFYRLNVINIQLPALRERRSDIPPLIEHFLTEVAQRTARPRKSLSEEAMALLCDYAWPGNIRELQNEIERLVLLSGGDEVIPKVLVSRHIQDSGEARHPVAGKIGGDLKAAVEEVEKNMIRQALHRLGGNKSEAARELGISRSSLIAKVQAYGLE